MFKEDFLKRLNESFGGSPWFGNSLLQQIKDLTAELAFYRPTPKNRCIAEILAHILAWRIFVVEKLKFNREYNLEVNSPEEWPDVEGNKIEAVKNLTEKLQANHKEIIDLIKSFDEEDFMEKVPGREYSFKYMLEGLLEHDTYHSGQIGLVKSIYNKVNDQSDK